ncbi:MAG TPA: transcriptional repressor [bacterium]|nr:transcriptional repressor [bacterium]HQB76470.1 transcriptional repressor [bacterium]HQM18914.1 transcriptional repressor [Candidatus Paceibacterota bacterium]
MIVSQRELSARLENFKKVSREHKLPLTPQKLAIFRTLASSCSHPDVSEIYHRVKEEFNNISLATVYKNLKKLVDLGLIVEIPIPGDNPRYDAKLDTHGHAVDTGNGRVYDLEISTNFALPDKILGKRVKQAQVIYYL